MKAKTVAAGIDGQLTTADCPRHGVFECADCAYDDDQSSFAAAAKKAQVEGICPCCKKTVGPMEGYWMHVHSPGRSNPRYEARLCKQCAELVESVIGAGV